MKIVFMGTPEIARQALAALLETEHEITAVYTRMDKPVGRKQVLTPPPVKLLAAEHQIPVHQPKTLRTDDAAGQLALLQPDLVVVVAYGLILPQAVLDVPRYGCVNLHVSDLPNYRGAAPVQWAVINGEEQMAVSIMQMDAGLDTGPVLAKKMLHILPDATGGEMLEQAGIEGSRLLIDTVAKIEQGGLTAAPQQGEGNYAPVLTKEIAKLDFGWDARRVHNLVRGCNPWPLSWFESGGKRVKLVKTTLLPDKVGASGSVLSLKPLVVACGQGAVELNKVVPEGSREMDGSQWAMGRRFQPGDSVLGEV